MNQSLSKRMKMLEFALASLMRRRAKSLAIVLVYAFTVSVLASVLFLTQSLRQEALGLLDAAPGVVVQKTMAGRHDLIPVAHADAIREIPGVGEVRPRYWGYYYDALTKANYTVVSASADSGNLAILKGRLPSGPGECALGAGVAGLRFAELDSDFVLIDAGGTGRSYSVTGIFRADSNLLTADLIVLDPGDLAELFAFPKGMATDLSVEVFNPEEVGMVAAKIKKALPDSRPITRQEILRTYGAVFDWRSGMILTIFMSALISFVILAWDKATGISAEEKREIGILKAIGWDASDVLELKFWEGAAVSVSAFLLGITAAYVHVFFFGAGLLAQVIRGWSVLFPAFRPAPSIDLYQIFVIGFFTVVPYIASTVVPSWKASVTDPDSVMRG